MDILAELQAIASDDYFSLRCYEITNSWEKAGRGEEVIDPVLEFMENNSEIDLGSPGPLVHFIEQFDSPNYRRKLIASIQRKPTAHTLWMLNRILNIANDPDEYDRLLAVMQAVLTNPAADQETLDQADDFLRYQLGKT